MNVVPKSTLEDHLHGFYATLESALAKAVQRRLGIAFDSVDDERDAMLARQFFSTARTSDNGFDQIFHDLYGGIPRCEGYDDAWAPLLDTGAARGVAVRGASGLAVKRAGEK
mgnify:CR=1 FL=1